VVTVVNMLFNLIQPNIAIFGEKDYQQLSIIRRMVSDLYMPIAIIEGETVREADGLAKSSRNRYLDDAQRQQAAHLSAALHRMQDAALHSNHVEEILALGQQYLQSQHIQAEYLSICSEATLEPLHTLQTTDTARIFIAAPIGEARLIDNMPLRPSFNTEDNMPCA
ncbi:MAG: pantoate--beta-alanine ligase, partial [Ghiorsea sp.]